MPSPIWKIVRILCFLLVFPPLLTSSALAQAFYVASVPVQVVSTDLVALTGKVEFTVNSGTTGAGVIVLAYDGVTISNTTLSGITISDTCGSGNAALLAVDQAKGLVKISSPSGCLPGENAADDTYEDGLGRTFTGHWVVEPGREENHTLVTHILNLPFDTTVHYVAVHLHPFAESIRLHDLTTGETVFESHADQFLDRIGLSHVESFSSTEGFPLYRTHDYELVSVYNNASRAPQDSMAVLNLYMLDRAFEGPAAR